MAGSESNLHSTHKRITGNSTGKTADFKRDGYAGYGPIPSSMRQSKVGKTPQEGYSGPPVATEKGR